MTQSTGHLVAPAGGVLGVFLVVLAAGLVLDGDRWWAGGVLMAVGAWLLAKSRVDSGGLA